MRSALSPSLPNLQREVSDYTPPSTRKSEVPPQGLITLLRRSQADRKKGSSRDEQAASLESRDFPGARLRGEVAGAQH